MNDTKGLVSEIEAALSPSTSLHWATRVLLERALTALKAQGWQDISTAPRDGTQVLLCRKGRKIWMCDGFWDVECWAWPYLKLEPTHWMPLPQPPKEPNNKEEAK